MVTYKYQAVSNSGQKVNGVLDAFNEMDAIDRIKQQHPIIIKITPVKEGQENGLLKDRTTVKGRALHLDEIGETQIGLFRSPEKQAKIAERKGMFLEKKFKGID